MADKKGWGKTVLGWFVVSDEQTGSEPSDAAAQSEAQGSSDVDALIRKYSGAGSTIAATDGSAAHELPGMMIQPQGPLPSLSDANVDLEKVYDAFGVDAEERDRVKRARDLLQTLPQETPAPVKRQIVEAALKSFGVPTEKIIEAAAEELQALEMFIRQGQGEVQSQLTDGSQRIQQLEQEIAAVRKAMDDVVTAQTARTSAVNGEKLRVQEVLEFFGQEAVAKVVQDSPKLQSPK